MPLGEEHTAAEGQQRPTPEMKALTSPRSAARERTLAVRELRRATERLHATVATLNAAQALSDAEITEFRQTLKEGRAARVGALAGVRRLVARYDALNTAARERLAALRPSVMSAVERAAMPTTKTLASSEEVTAHGEDGLPTAVMPTATTVEPTVRVVPMTSDYAAAAADAAQIDGDASRDREQFGGDAHRAHGAGGLARVPRPGDAARRATQEGGEAQPAAAAVALTKIANDPDRLEALGVHTKLVRHMLRGMSARAALIEVGLDENRTRWAQKLFARFQLYGNVMDRRWARKPAAHVVTPSIEERILLKWNGRKRANVRAIWRMVRDEVVEARRVAEENGQSVDGLVEPGYDAIYRYLRKLPKSVQTVRNKGIEVWDKQARPYVDYNPATHANHLSQIDHERVDVMVRVEVAAGVWEPRQAWLTVVLDRYSRAVMGYVLSTKVPDAWTTALALRHAILPKSDPAWPMCGIPELLVPDHGKDFMAADTARLARALGIILSPTPPYYPNMKAEVERFFGTINSFLSQLVGYMPADGRSYGAGVKRLPMLLTLRQLRSEIERFIGEYHHRPHRGIDNETPVARWSASVHVALPESEEDLNVLLLKDDATRTVTKGGVRFTAKTRVHVARTTADGDEPEELVEVRGGRYWSPALMDHWQEEVRVRYNPEDLDSILIYHAITGERLCEAWLMGFENSKYGAVEVKHLRAGYRKGLKERTTDYAKEVARDDRRSARAHDESKAAARTILAAAVEAGGDADSPSAIVLAPATHGKAQTTAKGTGASVDIATAKGKGTGRRPTPARDGEPAVVDLLAHLDRISRGKRA